MVDEQTKKSQQGLTSKKSHCKQKKLADPDSKDLDNIKGSAESSKVNDSISGMKKYDYWKLLSHSLHDYSLFRLFLLYLASFSPFSWYIPLKALLWSLIDFTFLPAIPLS